MTNRVETTPNDGSGPIAPAATGHAVVTNGEGMELDFNLAGLTKKSFVPLADVPDMVWKMDPKRRNRERPTHFADMDRKVPAGSLRNSDRFSRAFMFDRALGGRDRTLALVEIEGHAVRPSRVDQTPGIAQDHPLDRVRLGAEIEVVGLLDDRDRFLEEPQRLLVLAEVEAQRRHGRARAALACVGGAQARLNPRVAAPEQRLHADHLRAQRAEQLQRLAQLIAPALAEQGAKTIVPRFGAEVQVNAPVAGQVLVYQSTGKWANATSPAPTSAG